MASLGWYHMDAQGNYVYGQDPNNKMLRGEGNPTIVSAPKISFPEPAPPKPPAPKLAEPAPVASKCPEKPGWETVSEEGGTCTYRKMIGSSWTYSFDRSNNAPSDSAPSPVLSNQGVSQLMKTFQEQAQGQPQSALTEPQGLQTQGMGVDSMLAPSRSLEAKFGGPTQNQNIGLQLMDNHQLDGQKTNSYLDEILTNVAKYGADNYGLIGGK